LIALDLPPGVAVIDGRHNLTAKVSYALEGGKGGAVRLLTLSRADEIVVPLATLSRSGQQRQPIAAAPEANEVVEGTSVATAEPAAQPLPPPRPRVQPQSPAPIHTEPAKSLPQRQNKAAPPSKALPKPAPPPSRSAPVPAPAPAPVASVKPSFNCRYARTAGEIAVCGNPELAQLDRRMSAQFYSALAVARPGQRAMLQRTRNRFLSYRDSCRSTACIADAYRGRIREISDIMAGQW
jgi:outer membrane biosynthesis protein TonB